ncbi:MAG: type IV secretion system protein [Proteobacteria bacterium]|nr:type IV secretion system protein [Pseudomonadota bacterium]
MPSADNYAPFYTFDQTVQLPFTNGMEATVNAAMSAIQGPLTAVVVLWIIVTGILVMRGDVGARTGITRVISVSLVVGLLMSTTLYNEYIVSLFTTGIPDWLASTFLGVTGTQPTAHQFDAIWNEGIELFWAGEKNMNFYNVLYSVELAILQSFLVFPIGLTFLIYEATRIMIDVIVSIGPFLLLGYLFSATRGVADRFIGKLIGLTILTLLIDIVLSIIVNGDNTYFNSSMTGLQGASTAETIAICIQYVAFLTLGSLICTFLPAVASFLGGGISVSPLGMGVAAMQATRVVQAVREGRSRPIPGRP